MQAYERLLNYVRVHTASVEDAAQTPSSACQWDLSHALRDELTQLGVQGVYVDEHAYVYGYLPATPGCEDVPCIGFLAHLDTIPDFPGEHVQPRLVLDYDGGDIVLGHDRVLSPSAFPHLAALRGDTLIVTDGSTVLGADDKAGIAEIMTMAERLLQENIPHGRIAIAFCPDEEIGHGAALLDLHRFGARYAYTVDGGGDLCELEYENFNACAATVTVRGFNVHPGSAKDTMINACQVATQFHALLPDLDTPRDTEGYQGFFHLMEMQGTVEQAKLSYIVRDHDACVFAYRQQLLERCASMLNAQYGPGTVTVTIREQYRNMIEEIQKTPIVLEKAKSAMAACGITCQAVPIRGGTDGAQLTFRGLPCPNLPTGGFAFHGPYEHISIQRMDRCVELLLHIVAAYCE